MKKKLKKMNREVQEGNKKHFSLQNIKKNSFKSKYDQD